MSTHRLGICGKTLHVYWALRALDVSVEVEGERHGGHSEREEREHGGHTEQVPQPPPPAGVVDVGLVGDRVDRGVPVVLLSKLVSRGEGVRVPQEAAGVALTLPKLGERG